ncbi:SPOR domain-containing protein [Phenylobacterium sp.]|uniref:SPOR domain-containing protein n=1 Tax=Phenylobacterium sp. TaxID=1871053 RepID=UPI0025D5419D|nr:SPOR domain-containing protein [Phenylobacterium sp.]
MADAHGERWRRLGRAVLTAALGWSLGGAARAVEIEDLTGWLARTTDLRPSQVVLIGPDSIYSLEPLGAPLPTGEVMVLVRTEPLTDDWRALHGFTSWDANLLIDCPQRRVRVIRSATYPLRNRAGKPSPQASDGQAVSPLRNEPAAQLVAAACDADYVWPLRSGRAQRASAPQGPVAPPKTTPVAEAPTQAIPTEGPPMRSRPPPAVTASAPLEIVLPTAPMVVAQDSTPKPSGWALQLALGPSQDGADRAVKAARKALGPPAKHLVGWTSSSAEGEVQTYAGLLGGFGTFVAASAACESLKRAGQDCVVQKGAPAPEAGITPEGPPLATRAPEPTSHAIQVARGPSEDGARRALAKARKVLAPLAPDVRDALPTSRIPGDHMRFEARLEGFATEAAAQDACRKLTKAGQACFVLAPAGVGGAEASADR